MMSTPRLYSCPPLSVPMSQPGSTGCPKLGYWVSKYGTVAHRDFQKLYHTINMAKHFRTATERGEESLPPILSFNPDAHPWPVWASGPAPLASSRQQRTLPGQEPMCTRPT